MALGSYAYVTDSSAGLRVVDISNLTAMTLNSSLPLSSAKDFVVSGKYAHVADSTGLRIIE